MSRQRDRQQDESPDTSKIIMTGNIIRNIRKSCVQTYGGGFTIHNNEIHHCGQDAKYGPGLYFPTMTVRLQVTISITAPPMACRITVVRAMR